MTKMKVKIDSKKNTKNSDNNLRMIIFSRESSGHEIENLNL